jgi:hypothetical protein
MWRGHTPSDVNCVDGVHPAATRAGRPEQIRTHPLVRELVEDALRSDQEDTPELQELAKDLALIN